jgi:hypothetical protein
MQGINARYRHLIGNRPKAVRELVAWPRDIGAASNRGFNDICLSQHAVGKLI